MASSLSISSSSTIIDSRPPLRPPSSSVSSSASASSPSCISLPPLPLQTRAANATSYCRKIVRSFVTRATSEVPATTTEVVTSDVSENVKSDQEPSVQEVPVTTTEIANTTENADTEAPELVKSVQEVWEKVEDKYAVGSLALAGAVALWGTSGMISAIDRLPLVPGVLEVVGIGYTGWFAYKNLIFKPDREALFKKVKDTYKDILGIS